MSVESGRGRCPTIVEWRGRSYISSQWVSPAFEKDKQDRQSEGGIQTGFGATFMPVRAGRVTDTTLEPT